MQGITTTALSYSKREEQLARRYAKQLDVPFVPRDRQTLGRMLLHHRVEWLLVVGQRLAIHTPAGEWFYHPGLAMMRMKHILAGEDDHLKTVCELHEGDRVLDCTLGLASDALIFSHYAGDRGLVCGIERNPLVAVLTADGLRNYDAGIPEVNQALRRISVSQGDHGEQLSQLPDQSFDVVFFDPMFRNTVKASPGIHVLRAFGHPAPIAREAVEQASRVARKRVVMKERRGSGEFARLGFHICPRRSGSFTYGVIDTRP